MEQHNCYIDDSSENPAERISVSNDRDIIKNLKNSKSVRVDKLYGDENNRRKDLRGPIWMNYYVYEQVSKNGLLRQGRCGSMVDEGTWISACR